MKILKIVVLIALVSVVANAQASSDAVATYALKGPVRTFRMEVATFLPKDGGYVEGPRVLQMEASFNRDGNRTELKMYNDKGVLVRRIDTTFEDQRMIEARNYDGAGQAGLRIVDVHDDGGRLKERSTYNGDGSLYSKTTYKRNDLGQAIDVAEYSAEGVLRHQIKNTFEGSKLTGTERKIYRDNGSLESTVVYEAAKRRTETITYKPDGSFASRIVRTGQEIAHYGEDGALQKITVLSGERLPNEVILNKDGSRTRQAQLPDQLDEHGNWTKQTQWLTDSTGTKPLKVTYRAITYYEN